MLTMITEIDHNFSRAHRIVTASILPIVENYREHSNQVWEGSKFWKQFFEASANVSLSGYEEPPPEDSEIANDVEGEEEDMAITDSAQATPSSASYASPPIAQNGPDEGEDVTMTPNQYDDTASASAGDYSPSATPRARHQNPSKAPYASPYASLKRATLGASSQSDSDAPSTPNAQKASPSRPNAQRQQQQQGSSPFAPPSTYRHTAHHSPAHNDVLLHRVLDKNWRIQATPHSTARLPYRGTNGPNDSQHPSPAKPSTARKAARQRQQQHRNQGNDVTTAITDDLDSSPAAPAPELHAEIFDTPVRKGGQRGTSTTSAGAGVGPRVPGISVLTPAKGKDARPGRNAGTPAGKGMKLWDSDDEDSEGDLNGMGGMSPPKTMQFHVPQSRLVRTPGQSNIPSLCHSALSFTSAL